MQILHLKPEDEDDDGAAVELSAQATTCVVIKTTTRQVRFLNLRGALPRV